MRNGYASLSYGALRFGGIDGYGWSSFGYSSATTAYNLVFYNSDVHPLDYYNRFLAFPVHTSLLSPSLSYVRSGDVYINLGTLRAAGAGGDNWSEFARPSGTYIYVFVFNASGVYPSRNSIRYDAFPVLYPLN